MVYLFCLMPRFNLAFLVNSFRRQIELLLENPDMALKVVILSGLQGEEAVYPPADDGYTGLRPRDLIEDDNVRTNPRVVTLSSKESHEDGPPNPPVTLVSCVNVHSQVESQTEYWARSTFGPNPMVVTRRAHRPDISLEESAHRYIDEFRFLGCDSAIFWPVYMHCVLHEKELMGHLRYHRLHSSYQGGVTTLGESLPAPRLVDVSS